jgi:acetylglutamate kinase
MTKQVASISGPVVLKIGGAVCGDAIFAAVAAAHAEVEPGVVLVHGGGNDVDAHLQRLGLDFERRDGIRVTPAAHVGEVVAVLAGRVNTAVVAGLLRQGAAAVGLTLADGGLARTVKATGYDFDPGQVGEVAGGDPALVRTLLQSGYLPVIASIGLDDDGVPLNVNADHAAAGIASLIGATALVLVSDVPGVLDRAGRVVSQLTADEVEALIAAGEISGGMIPKARSAAHTAAAAGIPVTITTGRDPAALRRAVRGAGGGTRFTSGPEGLTKTRQTGSTPPSIQPFASPSSVSES